MTSSKEIGDDVIEEDEERRHFFKVLRTFKAYRTHCLRRLELMQAQYNRLSAGHKHLLPDHPSYFHKMKECMEENYRVLERLLQGAEGMFVNKQHVIEEEEEEGGETGWLEVEKVYSVLKQMRREWSEDGRQERAQSYAVVVKEILALLPESRRQDISILVPGVGLGRLAYDLSRLGFSCQGNEFSLFMLIASNFIINKCLHSEQHRIFPWVHDSTNCLQHSHQLRPCTFPDNDPPDYLLHSSSTTSFPTHSPFKPSISPSTQSFFPSTLPPINSTSSHSTVEHSSSPDKNNSHSHSNLPSSPTRSPTPPPSQSSPTSSPPNSPSLNNFSIVAGDFLQVYTQPSRWHCVATVFFLDTAHNILTYIERIFHILKPGGYWVNFGPLLYHFAHTKDSLELSYEQVLHAVRSIGFKLLDKLEASNSFPLLSRKQEQETSAS